MVVFMNSLLLGSMLPVFWIFHLYYWIWCCIVEECLFSVEW